MTRTNKTYNGTLMKKGTDNENIIMDWFRERNNEVIDLRKDISSQDKDIDFIVKTLEGMESFIEVKSDKWIKETGNFCFETQRINHFFVNRYSYTGWGWRSKADFLIVRNPVTKEAYLFKFPSLRKVVGKYVAEAGKEIKIKVVETDNQKTTINILIPMTELKDIYNKVKIPTSP